MMCNVKLKGLENVKQSFCLEEEMFAYFGEERAKSILAQIQRKFKNLFPLQATSIAFSGNGRFTDRGSFVTTFNHKEELYSYLITFRRRIIKGSVEVEETFYYAFN